MERERRKKLPKKVTAGIFVASLATTGYLGTDLVTRNNALDRQLAAQGVVQPSDREFDRAYQKQNLCDLKPSTPGCDQVTKTIADYRAYKGRFTPRDAIDIFVGVVGLGSMIASGGSLFRREKKTPPPQKITVPEGSPPEPTPERPQKTRQEILAARIQTRHIHKGPGPQSREIWKNTQ